MGMPQIQLRKLQMGVQLPKMEDLGQLTNFLGPEINRTKQGIHIHQQNYAEDLLTLAYLSDSKFAETPMELNIKYHKEDASPLPDSTI